MIHMDKSALAGISDPGASASIGALAHSGGGGAIDVCQRLKTASHTRK